MNGERASKRKGSIQDASSLLSRLEDETASLRKTDDGFHLEWASTGRSAVPIAEELVRLCLELDLIEANGAERTLSATGRSWLRRREASGDAFRQQHQLRANRLAEIDGARRTVLVNETESPLGWLKSRKDRNGRSFISNEQFDAGERLRADYWFAQLSPRVTANWSALAPSGRMRRGASSDAASLRDEVIAAKERVRRAVEAVGPELAGVLVDVCCELKGLERAEREKGWPQRAGKVVLQLALTRLARHYGIAGHEGSQSRRLRHWGSEGYRPTLETWRERGT